MVDNKLAAGRGFEPAPAVDNRQARRGTELAQAVDNRPEPCGIARARGDREPARPAFGNKADCRNSADYLSLIHI